MRNLNPTLWRTCRILSGKTRMKLLRCLEEHPGQNVTQLAKAVGIGISDASQELRRIQSRGLLKAERRHTSLIYHFSADPQVASARPLLKALQKALAIKTPNANKRLCEIANSLGHVRRIEMLKALMKKPQTAYSLQKEIQISQACIRRHLQPLLKCGFIQQDKKLLRYFPPRHPLAKALIRLLPE